MKLYSFAQKLGLVLVGGIGFFLIPSIQSIKSQSFSPFIAPSPGTSITKSGPVDTLPKSDSLTCDRLTGSMCNLSQSTNQPRSIEQLDNSQTSLICGYTGNCSPSDFPPIDSELLQQTIASISTATNSQTVVIYPEILEDRIKILVVLPSGKEFRKVVTNVNQQDLTDTLVELLNSIRDPSSEDYLPSAQKLYNWLIRPIEVELTEAKAKTLVFVMDGPLRAIPIGALHDGNKFLVQKYATATVPSMRLVIKDLRDDLQLRDRRRSKILIMGLTKAMQGFSALPNVAVETQTALKMFGGNERVFLDEEFTIENLKKQQNANNTNYDIVHLATHAQFLSNTPEGAFIQFWQNRLSLEDIKTIRLGENKIEMLALSACQTAVGQNLGLSGTMLIYRAKSILSSLWTVSDAGTPALMLSFYNYYPTAKSKAIAIQQAQLDLLEGRVTIEAGKIKGIGNLPAIPLNQVSDDINLKHPYFWASFILVGNWL
ncbi:CHAT domain-containing protein [Pseudanabaena yagii]|uniref:CHAT domain-containing protein n=1 Tax=Pseudanabaena yagii GIHE-NHR1 TaxID=2722753 RepID=A0ABX1LRK1_9CYAN|nr:CHAT domain-containing protein [Pseudanabaena yagii]NMF57434.1 CHAT domain-containing protein [Pseudanabaena yagii GIHE-NHR1]